MGHRVSQEKFLRCQLVVLVGVVQPCSVQLRHLVPEEVDLTDASPLVTTEGV